MKKLFKPVVAVLACGLTLAAFAASPRFSTKNDGGNASGGAEVCFPSDAGSQTRIVNVLYQSDTNTGALQFSEGVGVYNIVVTNALSSSVTNQIGYTNGLTPSSILVLEHLGICYPATMSSWGSNAPQGAFVVLASGGFGVSSTVGDKVFQMSAATTVPVGAATNILSGYSIYAAAYAGRPVRVVLTPALGTNRLNSVSAIYE